MNGWLRYRTTVRRFLALLILVLGLAPGILWRDVGVQRGGGLDLEIIQLGIPRRDEYAKHLGPFELEAIWQMTSPEEDFGGFSSLLPPRGGEMIAISDMGWQLHFSLPGGPGGEPQFRRTYQARKMWPVFNDTEAATRDPLSGKVWLASEGRNAVARFGPDMRFEGLVMPASISRWGQNSAVEAMTRLPDGRFVVLREAFTGWFEKREHDALVFDTDPVEGARARPFKVSGPASFSPTELAKLPDGRLLVLFRRPVWLLPVRFAGRIAIGDPRQIKEGEVWRLHEVARLATTLPVDNFEGMAVEPRPDGRLNVWLISDDNRSVFQRTLLWKLNVDPADLPGARGKARGDATPLSARSD
jgi:hypothetical protein